jgi:hypothetical protein
MYEISSSYSLAKFLFNKKMQIAAWPKSKAVGELTTDWSPICKVPAFLKFGWYGLYTVPKV